MENRNVRNIWKNPLEISFKHFLKKIHNKFWTILLMNPWTCHGGIDEEIFAEIPLRISNDMP